MQNALFKINKWFTISRIKFLFVAYTILLLLVAILPINSSGAIINHTFIVSIRLDYFLHCIIFLPWLLLMRKFSRTNIQLPFTKSFMWIIAGLFFAVFIEAVQFYLPYRAFNINDLLANGLGILLGALFFIK